MVIEEPVQVQEISRSRASHARTLGTSGWDFEAGVRTGYIFAACVRSNAKFRGSANTPGRHSSKTWRGIFKGWRHGKICWCVRSDRPRTDETRRRVHYRTARCGGIEGCPTGWESDSKSSEQIISSIQSEGTFCGVVPKGFLEVYFMF